MAALNLYRYAELFRSKDIKGVDLLSLDKDKLTVIPPSSLSSRFYRWKMDGFIQFSEIGVGRMEGGWVRGFIGNGPCVLSDGIRLRDNGWRALDINTISLCYKSKLQDMARERNVSSSLLLVICISCKKTKTKADWTLCFFFIWSPSRLYLSSYISTPHLSGGR